MGSDTSSQATGRGSRHRASKVTTQHTLERVRNNQRRHRARRHEYIATLEQKLSRAEESIKALNGQVIALQTELAQCRERDGQTVLSCPQVAELLNNDTSDTPPLPLHSRERDAAGVGLLPHPAELNTARLPTQPLRPTLSGGFPGIPDSEPIEINSPRTGWEATSASGVGDILLELTVPNLSLEYVADASLSAVPGPIGAGRQCHSKSCDAQDPSLQTDSQLRKGIGTLLSATATQDHVLTTTETCCFDGQPLPNDGETRERAMEAYAGYSADGESTILCAEAYLLIAQQNFKGVSQQDVMIWLWNGFRRSLIPNEGCRVKTDLLYNLLAFISDE